MTTGGAMSQEPFSKKPMKRETLADRVAADITQHILAGDIEGEMALPTEPELAEQYGVSRSVIRDATRLLSARGLVEIRHGKGVFVTASQKEPFADALMLALRRDNATAWDAEEFTLQMFPVAVALATANGTEEEIAGLESLAERFLHALAKSNETTTEAEFESLNQDAQLALDQFQLAIYRATHNKVMHQFAEPLRSLRKLRRWDLSHVEDDMDQDTFQQLDRVFLREVLSCLRSGDPNRAYSKLAPFASLPPEAVAAMRKTPIGESPRIVIRSPLPVPEFHEDLTD